MTFISVDLPEPDGPMMAQSSPSAIVKEMPLSTGSSIPARLVDLRDVMQLNRHSIHPQMCVVRSGVASEFAAMKVSSPAHQATSYALGLSLG